MCLIVRQKFEPNDNSVICYKVVKANSWGYKWSVYMGTYIDDDFLAANEHGPQFYLHEGNLELHGGCIHCFSNRQDAMSILHKWEDREVWKVMGYNLIAVGLFGENREALAFQQVEFLEKIA